VIDPHVHLRDWSEAGKETVRHGLEVAGRAGLDAVFEMPNTSPPLTRREVIERRLELASAAGVDGILHGLYAGVTADPVELREVVEAHAALFPRVVGLKLFAGHSTGGMGIVTLEEQRRVYRALVDLGYRGVLSVHAEKEALLRTLADGKPDWDPRRPSTHCAARPPEAEARSVEEQLAVAADEGFCGVLHIAHISTPPALEAVRAARRRGGPFRVSCGITPHHALLAEDDMEGERGILLKMNPPLRPRGMQRAMLGALVAGEIDWIETDHAPHTVADKEERHASGIPVLPFYPRFLRLLRSLGVSTAELDRLTHGAVEDTFGFRVPRGGRAAENDLAGEYPWDPFAAVRDGEARRGLSAGTS
jgi:dihydroorotase